MASRSVRVPIRDRVVGQPGRGVLGEGRNEKDVPEIEARQHEPWQQRAGVHVADRAAELVGHDDEHERGRHDLCERSGSRDRAGCEARVIAVAQHDRQRDEAHGYDGGRDDAGRRREQGADENDRVRNAAAHGPEQLAYGFEQILGHAGAFENEPHERKERDREQRLVAHHPEDALGQGLEQRPGEIDHAARIGSELYADDEEHQPDGGEREGDRIAGEQDQDERREHDRREVLSDELDHIPLRGA